MSQAWLVYAAWIWIFILVLSLCIYLIFDIVRVHRKATERKLEEFEIKADAERKTQEYQPTLKEIERFYKRIRKGIHRTNELLLFVNAPYHIKIVKVWDRPEERPQREDIETELSQSPENETPSNPI